MITFFLNHSLKIHHISLTGISEFKLSVIMNDQIFCLFLTLWLLRPLYQHIVTAVNAN